MPREAKPVSRNVSEWSDHLHSYIGAPKPTASGETVLFLGNGLLLSMKHAVTALTAPGARKHSGLGNL